MTLESQITIAVCASGLWRKDYDGAKYDDTLWWCKWEAKRNVLLESI
jgi:hypothetical protein